MNRIIAINRSRHGTGVADVTNAEQWREALDGFDERVRHVAADLAAHSWDVTRVGDQLLISCAWYKPHNLFWWDKSGNKTPLTEEEMDQFYPILSKEDASNRLGNGESGKRRTYTIQTEHLTGA